MFEREAQDYSIDTYETCLYDNLPYVNDSRAREESFKDGAEFGYNKANEWHKQDIPTSQINKVVLGYIKDYNSKMFCLVKWNGKWWYDARTYNERVKLIAWREIELPKESENDR